MSWPLEACIQHPGAKLKTSVVLIGREGVGKNSLLIPVERIYGQYAINITEAELYADFCPWKKDKQFIVGNEVGGERDKRQVMDKLKDLITSPTMIINEKFMPQYELPNVPTSSLPQIILTRSTSQRATDGSGSGRFRKTSPCRQSFLNAFILGLIRKRTLMRSITICFAAP